MVQDTIVAQATPPGMGALAVVRISGPRAVALASVLTGSESWEPRRATLRSLALPSSDQVLDQAIVVVYPGPASYTGEDVVEISTHGGYLIPTSVVEACVALGARRARPGEFTQRAYLNGRMDLTQAEAVADLIAAGSPKARAVAIHQLERGLGERVAALRQEIVVLEAHLVQHVDFPEEDDAPVSLESVSHKARGLTRAIESLVETAPSGELLRDGALAVLAGPPNSGKSSLFNALLGQERAIVTEVAGTTRDALEASVAVGGFPFRLVDTAGLREQAERIERLGIEVAERYLGQADLVLFCKEGGAGLSGDEEAFLQGLGAPVIRVATKMDLHGGPPKGDGEGWVHLSARSGDGLSRLREAMMELVFRGVVENRNEVPVVTNRRQRDLLEVALREVDAFAEALDAGVPPEFAQAHLKDAESALEEIVGLIGTEEVLDRVFREFCIGK